MKNNSSIEWLEAQLQNDEIKAISKKIKLVKQIHSVKEKKRKPYDPSWRPQSSWRNKSCGLISELTQSSSNNNQSIKGSEIKTAVPSM